MLHILLQYRYFILLPITIVEGPIVAFVVGYLIQLGYLQILPSAILLFLGDFIPDTAYYFFGFYSNEKKSLQKYVRKLGLTQEREIFVRSMWHDHTKKTLFLSKLAYGLSTPFILSAGIAKYPYRKFILGTMCITVLQYGVLATLGYFFGTSYASISGPLKDFAIAIAIIAIILLYIAYTRFTKSIANSMSGNSKKTNSAQ